MDAKTCTACGASIRPLEAFPGCVCLSCHIKREEGQPIMTAEQLVGLWVGKQVLR